MSGESSGPIPESVDATELPSNEVEVEQLLIGAGSLFGEGVCDSPGSVSIISSSSKSPAASEFSLPSPAFCDRALTAVPKADLKKSESTCKNKSHPKNIPLSRISGCSSSTDESLDESSATEAEDPRSKKISYATLGELVFSRCAFNASKSFDSFKDRAGEWREKIKQRKVEKDCKRDEISSRRSFNENVDDDLVKDLEQHSKRDLKVKKASDRMRQTESPTKHRVRHGSSESGKVTKNKLNKASKLKKLDLLEEYAQMLRDAIKEEAESDEDSSYSQKSCHSKAVRRPEKLPAKNRPKSRERTPAVAEVIKLEPLSEDEMDVDPPSPESVANKGLPKETPIVIKEEEEDEEVVVIKSEPGAAENSSSCCGAQKSWNRQINHSLNSANNFGNPTEQSTLPSYQPKMPSTSQTVSSAVSPTAPDAPSNILPPLPPPLPLLSSTADNIIPFPPPPFPPSVSTQLNSQSFNGVANVFQSSPQCSPNSLPPFFAPHRNNAPDVTPSFRPHCPTLASHQHTSLGAPPSYTPFASPLLSPFRHNSQALPPLPPNQVPPPTFNSNMYSNSNSSPATPISQGCFNFVSNQSTLSPVPPMFSSSNNIPQNGATAVPSFRDNSSSHQLSNLTPVAQVNSTIVLDPNNPRAPLTFNTKLTSYIPESFAAAQITPTFSTANLCSQPSTSQSFSNLNVTSPSAYTSQNQSSRVENKTQSRYNSESNEGADQGCNVSRKRARSPLSTPVEVSIDFSKEISFETFLGNGLSSKHRATNVSPTKKASMASTEFDFTVLRSEVNKHGWMVPHSSMRKRHLDRYLVSSTSPFDYYQQWDEQSEVLLHGCTGRMREIQSAFEALMRNLSRETVLQECESHVCELTSVSNRLTNLMLRQGNEVVVDKKSGQNRKTADVMLKQLRIKVAETNGSKDEDIWKSHIDSLLSLDLKESNHSQMPGESYHSKAARSRKKKTKPFDNSNARRSLLISRIDNFLEQSDINDDLISEKLKLDYVTLRRAERSRLHSDIYPNEPGFFCDKPACTCLGENKLVGPHHGFFHNDPMYERCDPETNNLSKLHHYYVNMTPRHHFFLPEATKIRYNGHDYEFSGYSIFSHELLENIPPANYTKGQTQYSLEIVKEPPPSSFSIRDCDLLSDFIFYNLLEFFDFSLLDDRLDEAGLPYCRKFHILPRFERELPESGIELLSAHVILRHILSSFVPLFDKNKLADVRFLDGTLKTKVAASLKDHLVYYPGRKPSCVRVDNLAFDVGDSPRVCHTSLLPSTLSFLGDKKFLNMKKLHAKIKETMHFRNDPTDQDWLQELEGMMAEHKRTKRATVVCDLPVENCFFSGLKCDVTHCAVYLPRVIFQIRRHLALQRLCKKFNYTIRNPLHFEVAFTHSTACENVLDGTNKSHVRASRYRVGKNMNDVPINERGRTQKIKAAKHKRNLFTMIQTMRALPRGEDELVDYPTTENYERVEFLGDAVLEMIVTTHLFFMLPDAKEGILSLFRIPLVANTHLSKVSKKAGLHRHLVISHDTYFNLPGPREKIHADILESFLGAIFLDSGLPEADRIFAQLFFTSASERKLWTDLKPHEFQQQYPDGDRDLIETCDVLKKLLELEQMLGIEFNHISLLARALTSNALGHNFLSRSNNERLEFLGDTVMKLLVTNFIYRHFPVYHENHLSTLRGSLVSRFVQEEVAKELRLSEFTLDKLCADLNQHQSCNLVTTKRKADLFEAFLAAVFIDQGLETCQRIFKVCIFPKIPKLLKNQKWLTPHLMLHCCFLAIRSVADLEKSLVLIPSYRVLSSNEVEDSRASNKALSSHSSARNANQQGMKRVGVFIGGKMFGVGCAKSLNQAAVQACREALTFFQSKHPNTLATLLNERVESIVNNRDNHKDDDATSDAELEPKSSEAKSVPAQNSSEEVVQSRFSRGRELHGHRDNHSSRRQSNNNCNRGTPASNTTYGATSPSREKRNFAKRHRGENSTSNLRQSNHYWASEGSNERTPGYLNGSNGHFARTQQLDSYGARNSLSSHSSYNTSTDVSGAINGDRGSVNKCNSNVHASNAQTTNSANTQANCSSASNAKNFYQIFSAY